MADVPLPLEPDARYDRITRVAARTFDVPIAVIALGDAERHWPGSLDAAGEEGLVIEDAHERPDLRDHPMVTGEPRVRFCAGHVIRDREGSAIGALRIADRTPRAFPAADVQVLRDLACWAEEELASTDLGEALRARGESEQRLGAVMATVADGVVAFGEDGVIESVNPAAERMFGLPEGFLVGERVDKLLHLLTWEELEGLLHDGPKSIIGQLIEVTGRRSDYTPFPLELTVGRTRLGRRSLYVGVGRDITERRAAEDALERVRLQNELILESVNEGIIGLDREARVTFVNPAAAELLGRYAYEMIGLRVDAIVDSRHDSPSEAAITLETSSLAQTLSDGIARTAERWITRLDGTTFPAAVGISATRVEREITGAVLTIQDITQRYAVDRMKDEFVSVVGHELRTPLTSIRGSLGLLAGGVLGDIPEQAERMLQIAISNTDRLVRLINDILDLERIQAGRVELELAPQDARELLETTVQVVGVTAAEKRVTLTVEAGDERVLADHDRILQALTNLAGNAVKFSPEDAEVVLAARTDGDEVRLEVRDRGRGIPPEQIESIFERFEQVDASDARELGGTGLGLAIARSIVDQHGGRIWAESELGEGATFVIALPQLVPEAPRRDRPAVLVTGGDEGGRAQLAAMLEGAGYRAATVIDPGPFAAVLVAGEPLDAAGTLSALRARPETAGVPLVFVGRQGDEELLEAIERAAGALDPHRVLVVEDDLDLGRVLARLLERHGAHVRLARTGRQAIEAVDEVAPDLLLLDLILPEGDGFTVVDHLRRDPQLAAIPLVVYTAVDVGAEDAERLQLGDTRIMTKGRSTPADVEEHVKRLLETLS